MTIQKRPTLPIPENLSEFVEKIKFLYFERRIPPPTSIGYNDFAILFALTQYFSWDGFVHPKDMSEALRASRLTPENAREPRVLDAYFRRFEEIGLIRRTPSNCYKMDSELAIAILDNAENIMTSGLERFLESVAAFCRLD